MIDESPEDRGRRRLFTGRLIERLRDPDREHPILKKLLMLILPIIIEYFVKQLPFWLADLSFDDDD